MFRKLFEAGKEYYLCDLCGELLLLSELNNAEPLTKLDKNVKWVCKVCNMHYVIPLRIFSQKLLKQKKEKILAVLPKYYQNSKKRKGKNE